MPVRLLPDAERLVGAYLRGHADVVALVAARVSTELPANPTYPVVTVTRVGGVPSLAGYLDVARMEVSCLATTKAAAHTLARTVEAALLGAPAVAHALGVVTDSRQVGDGLNWNPDEGTDMPRYTFVVELYIHPPA